MLVMKQLFGFLRGKALNHTPSILRSTLYVNRGRWRLRLKAGGDSSPATKSGNSKSSATSACSISSAAGSIGSCRERPSQTEKRRRAAALQKMHSRPRQNPPATASPQRPRPAEIPRRRRLPSVVAPGFPPVCGGPDGVCREARHLCFFYAPKKQCRALPAKNAGSPHKPGMAATVEGIRAGLCPQRTRVVPINRGKARRYNLHVICLYYYSIAHALPPKRYPPRSSELSRLRNLFHYHLYQRPGPALRRHLSWPPGTGSPDFPRSAPLFSAPRLLPP